MTLWIDSGTRETLLDIIVPKGRHPAVHPMAYESWKVHVPHHKPLTFIWGSAPQEPPALPVMVLVHTGSSKDFLAWASTYLPKYRPFTAYCRIIDAGDFERLDRLDQRPDLGCLDVACAAITVLEATVLASRRGSSPQLSPLACASTLSFVMARAIALGLAADVSNLVEKWQRARDFTRQRERTISQSHIVAVWNVMARLRNGLESPTLFDSRPDNEIVAACQEMLRTKELSRSTWDRLTGVGEESPPRGGADETVEHRVLSFESFANSLLSRNVGSAPSASFALGYAASRVSPSSLEHHSLLDKYSEQFPVAVLWYALCVGLSRDAGVLGFSNGLVRRVLRDVLFWEPLLQRPRCDIALSELEMSQGRRDELGIGDQSVLSVELYPLVYATLRSYSRAEEVASGTPSGGAKEPIELLNDAAREIQLAIRALEHVRRSRIAGGNEQRPRTARERKGAGRKGFD